MKSCICKERIHWKQRPKNIYDVDKKIKANTWKWDLFRLKQRTYTSLGVVIVPHVNCTQNDGTKCSFLRNPIEPTDALWFAYVNIYGPSHSTLLQLYINETHYWSQHLHKHSYIGSIYTSDIINVQDMTIIFQLGFPDKMSVIYDLHLYRPKKYLISIIN